MQLLLNKLRKEEAAFGVLMANCYDVYRMETVLRIHVEHLTELLKETVEAKIEWENIYSYTEGG